MPEQIIFKDVIESMGVEFIVHSKATGSAGQYINGKWVSSASTQTTTVGIILPLVAGSKSVGAELTYIENGVYTAKDKKLYVVDPIELGIEVEYKQESYTIQAFTDLTEYTDVHIYIMRFRANAREGG
ncbi:hypothetical protein [Metasolibacillus sp.]|uniref:hypothetical protein n=1 Tax=Metasolibacillus sp. TaxID=2703680 RepID=UPI0025CFBD41|nr:hypothetical protein [Metasolibacillus sp.]MCT6926163.1 hypothetical protein [Metasolibacillus sp.]MCT6942404.1 hypothetical protein [Metasolibacillus sp.]